jgi:hypothetical protein
MKTNTHTHFYSYNAHTHTHTRARASFLRFKEASAVASNYLRRYDNDEQATARKNGDLTGRRGSGTYSGRVCVRERERNIV